MASFNELVFKVGDWSNRSDLFTQTTQQKTNNEATSTIIKDFLDIAMKRINNTLRIPPMEQLSRVTISAAGDDLTIPADMIEPIYIRTINTDGETGFVYNAKVGSRNFIDSTTDGSAGYSQGVYSRRANKYTFNPVLSKDDIVELYYYRVLPDLDATFPNTPENTGVSNTTKDATNAAMCSAAAGTVTSDSDGDFISCNTQVRSDNMVGEEVPQWFRDEAEEVLLYGALAELFAYLGEEMDQERWFRKFEDKLRELREEEAYREWRGGTIVTNIITNGLI